MFYRSFNRILFYLHSVSTNFYLILSFDKNLCRNLYCHHCVVDSLLRRIFHFRRHKHCFSHDQIIKYCEKYEKRRIRQHTAARRGLQGSSECLQYICKTQQNCQDFEYIIFFGQTHLGSPFCVGRFGSIPKDQRPQSYRCDL